jgi:hypothetical protein
MEKKTENPVSHVQYGLPIELNAVSGLFMSL